MTLENILSSLKDTTADTNGLMHLHSLTTHIHETTEKVLGWEESPSNKAMRYLVKSFTRFAFAYYNAVREALYKDEDTKHSPNLQAYWQQQAIERLADGWQSLSHLLYAVKDPRTSTLASLLNEALPPSFDEVWIEEWVQQEQLAQSGNRAWHDTIDKLKGEYKRDWADWKGTIPQDTRQASGSSRGLAQAEPRGIHTLTIPHYSRSFDLVHFSYAPGIFVTGVPLYNLLTPWDWQVIWHEAASHIVRQLEARPGSGGQVNDIERMVNEISELQREGGPIWETWATKFNDGRPIEDQAGWVSELLEDAYSVLSLGPAQFLTLQRVLRQHYENLAASNDDRHPPAQLRYDMAGALLLEMGFEVWLTEWLATKANPTTPMTEYQALQPVAEILYARLANQNDPRAFVIMPFDTDHQEKVKELKQKLHGNIPNRFDEIRSKVVQTARVLHAAFRAAQDGAPQAEEVAQQAVGEIIEPLHALITELVFRTDYPKFEGDPVENGFSVTELIAATALAFEEAPEQATSITANTLNLLQEIQARAVQPQMEFRYLTDSELADMFKDKDYRDLIELPFQFADQATSATGHIHSANEWHTLEFVAHTEIHKIPIKHRKSDTWHSGPA